MSTKRNHKIVHRKGGAPGSRRRRKAEVARAARAEASAPRAPASGTERAVSEPRGSIVEAPPTTGTSDVGSRIASTVKTAANVARRGKRLFDAARERVKERRSRGRRETPRPKRTESG